MKKLDDISRQVTEKPLIERPKEEAMEEFLISIVRLIRSSDRYYKWRKNRIYSEVQDVFSACWPDQSITMRMEIGGKEDGDETIKVTGKSFHGLVEVVHSRQYEHHHTLQAIINSLRDGTLKVDEWEELIGDLLDSLETCEVDQVCTHLDKEYACALQYLDNKERILHSMKSIATNQQVSGMDFRPITLHSNTLVVTVKSSGKHFVVDEQQYRILQVLAEVPGRVVIGKQFSGYDDQIDVCRVDRIIRRLPKPLSQLIKRTRGKGYILAISSP